MRTTRLLAAVSIIASTVALAACAGGGGAGEPCCSATGQVDQPTTAFAPAAIPYVEAFTLAAPDECVDYDATGIVVPEDRIVVGAGEVTGGRFDIELDDEAIGRQVFFRVYDEGGDPNVTLALGALAVSSAYHATESFRVSPMRVPFLATRVGESTLETVAYCRLKQAGQLQNMVLADVRAAVSSAMVASFTLGDTAAEARISARIIDYRHAVNGVVAYVTTAGLPSTNVDAFRKLRELAEQDADSCRDGVKPSEAAQSLIPCNGNPRLAEFYRGWALAHRSSEVAGFDFGRNFNLHLLAWAHDLEKKLGATLAAGDPEAVEVARTSRMMRVEAIDGVLVDAATRAGVSAAAIDAARDSINAFRLSVLTSDPGAGNEFAALSDEILLSFWNDTGLLNAGCAPPPDTMKNNADSALATFTSDFADPTHKTIVDFFDQQASDLDTNLQTCTLVGLDTDAVKRGGWVDLFLFFTMNDADVR